MSAQVEEGPQRLLLPRSRRPFGLDPAAAAPRAPAPCRRAAAGGVAGRRGVARAERPGRAQAEALVARLADLRVRRVLSSPSLRCRQTVVPLARSLDIDVEVCPELSHRAPLDRLQALLEDDATEGAVFCTHREVLGRLFAELSRAAGSPVPATVPPAASWTLARGLLGRPGVPRSPGVTGAGAGQARHPLEPPELPRAGRGGRGAGPAESVLPQRRRCGSAAPGGDMTFRSYEVRVTGPVPSTLVEAVGARRRQRGARADGDPHRPADQAALLGLLARLRSLGIELIEVRQLGESARAARGRLGGLRRSVGRPPGRIRRDATTRPPARPVHRPEAGTPCTESGPVRPGGSGRVAPRARGRRGRG